MPDSGEHHGQTYPVGCVNDFLVTLGAARLNDCGHAILGDLLDSIREREKSVGGHNSSFQ